VRISWARNNRSALVRVPVPKRGKADEGTRLEYRALDPACNPYLAWSVILAAGMAGVRGGYELPEEATAEVLGGDAAGEAGRRSDDESMLPQNLAVALDRMESSELVRSCLGEHIFEWFLRNKRAEWAAYRTHVSTFELQRYLRVW
jgi:glutamine synthetase